MSNGACPGSSVSISKREAPPLSLHCQHYSPKTGLRIEFLAVLLTTGSNGEPTLASQEK
jgi:hypothetical protein